MDPDDNQLQGMDLMKSGENDSIIENEFEWNERKIIHDALENSNLLENKPSHKKYFEVAQQTTQGNLRCNLVIPVLKIPGGHSDGSLKKIAAEHTWAMAEAAEWSKKQLHYEEIKVKGHSVPVKYASDPESYSVPNYNEYIPVQVKNAEND